MVKRCKKVKYGWIEKQREQNRAKRIGSSKIFLEFFVFVFNFKKKLK
jgi:hypothetical protein